MELIASQSLRSRAGKTIENAELRGGTPPVKPGISSSVSLKWFAASCGILSLLHSRTDTPTPKALGIHKFCGADYDYAARQKAAWHLCVNVSESRLVGFIWVM